MLPEKVAVFKGRLLIGEDGQGRIRSGLDTDEQLTHFGEVLAEHKRTLTHPNTADCMDDRPTIRLADGTIDLAALANRITNQLPGGLTLAVTKAGVAANAAFVRDAKNFKSAYDIADRLLEEMGYQDGGHEGCGASKFVEVSVAKPVNNEILLPTITAISAVNDPDSKMALQIQSNKQRRLNEAFYSGWDPAWHQDRLTQKVPQNFSYLKTADDAVHGHYANGISLISEHGMGFAKNAFYENTGQMAFAITTGFIEELAGKLSGTEEEKASLIIAFADDIINVSDKLIATGMPAFADAT